MTPEERARWATDLIPAMEATRRRHVTAAILESIRQAYSDGWSARGRIDRAVVEERLLTARTGAPGQDLLALVEGAIREAGELFDGEKVSM